MNDYTGQFNWCGQIIELTTQASNYTHAKNKFFSVLAKRLGKSSIAVFCKYFSGVKDNFKIKEV